MNNAQRSLIITAVVLSGSALLSACERDRADVRTDNIELQRRETDRSAERMTNDNREATERAARETAERNSREATERAARETAERNSREAANREAQPVATRSDFRAALGEIAQARCAHEVRCNNVGQGRRYMNEQTCRTVLTNELSRDLNVADCNAGIDRNELRECMNDINTEQCGNPIDTITRVAACRTADLCRNTTVGMR